MSDEYFHFRCFVDQLNEADLVSFLKETTDVDVITHEEGLNIRQHIHSIIRIPIRMNTWRDHLLKKFPTIKGNKSYSCAVVKKYDEMTRYCLKGRVNDWPDVLYTKYTEDQVKEFYSRYWKIQDEILAAKRVSVEVNTGCQNDPSTEIRVKRVRAPTWSQKLTTTIIKEFPGLCNAVCQHYSGVDIDYDEGHESLTSIILENMGQASKNLDEYILTRIYNAQVTAIIAKTATPVQKSVFHKRIARNIKSKVF